MAAKYRPQNHSLRCLVMPRWLTLVTATLLLALMPPVAHASNKDGLTAYGDPFGELPITIPQYTKIQFQLDFTKVPPSSHCPALPNLSWNSWYDVLYIPTNGAAPEGYPDYLYPPPTYVGSPPAPSNGPCLTSSPTPNTESGVTYHYNAWYPPTYIFSNAGNYNLTYALYPAYCDSLCQYWFDPHQEPPPVFGARGVDDARTLNFPAPPGGFPLGNVGGDFYYYCYLLDYYVYSFQGFWSTPLDCAIDKNASDQGNYVVHVKTGVPSGANQFNVVEPGTLDTTNNTGPIYTQIAGMNYTLNLWIFNQNGQPLSKPDQTIEIYLYDAQDNSGQESPAGSGCLSTWSKIADLGSYTFNGSDPLQITLPAYANALPDARLYLLQTAGQGPAGSVSCSTDDFAIRPAYFTIHPTDGSWITAGTTRALDATTTTGTPIHKAGRPFTITLIPKNAAGATVSGYGSPGTPHIVESLLAPPSSAGGVLGTLLPGSWIVPPASATSIGEAVTNAASYSEVGAIGLHALDTGFAVVDANDGTPVCQRTIGENCSAPGTPPYWNPSPTPAGRFVPDHFAVTENTPEFTTFCPVPSSATGGFTYIGQPFKYTVPPVLTVMAENANGAITKNYADFSTGNWFHLDATSLPPSVYVDANGHQLDTAALPTPDVKVAPAAGTHGTGYITFTAGPGIDYARGAATAPFEAAIDLSQQVKDTDNVEASPSATVTFADIAWDNGNWLRYGRLAIQNAYGSELMPLSVPLSLEYYAGANNGFITNTKDSCTSGLKITLSNYKPQPAFQSATSVATFTQPASAGVFSLDLSAPGAGHTGDVTVAPSAASASTLSWLEYPWTRTATESFPTALAVFGIYQGHSTTVFTHRVSGGG